MKKTLLLFLCGILAASCEDKNYDLGNINTDSITIGNDESVFKMPLAKVEVTLSEISEGGVNITNLLDEAKIWMPTAIPARTGSATVDYVEINYLQTDEAYVSKVLDALIDEMSTNEQKLDEVTALIWDKYADSFIPLLNLPAGVPVTETLFKEAFKLNFDLNTAIHDQAKEEAANYLTAINIDPLQYPIQNINIGSDIVDMLAKNLDPADMLNPKNTLCLYGSADSKLPLSVALDPVFSDTSGPLVSVNKISLEADGKSDIDETRIFENDIRAIVDGKTSIDISIQLKKYFPGKAFQENVDKQLVITLYLIKRGGLTIEL